MHITPENLEALTSRITIEVKEDIRKNCRIYLEDTTVAIELRGLMEGIIDFAVNDTILIFIKSVEEKQEP